MTAIAWLLFSPPELGGQASFVVISGDSMNPALESGDLLISRQSDTYNINDVVVYRHPELGPVAHRIVNREEDRFVLKGDANSWTDGYLPREQDIIGRQWLHVPHAGYGLRWLQQPLLLALLVLGIGAIGIMTRSKHKVHASAPAGHRWQLSRRAQDLLLLLSIVALGATGLGILAFSRSTESVETRTVAYEHSGQFSYTADAPPGVYDGDQVTSGDPIFRWIIDEFNVAFNYNFVSSATAALSGTHELLLEISSDNGWSRQLVLQEATAFSGESFSSTGVVYLSEVQALIDEMEAQTGVSIRRYDLTIQPHTTIEGTVAGEPFDARFAPQLRFFFDDQQLQTVSGSAQDGDPFQPVAGDTIEQSAPSAAVISLPLVDLGVREARWISVAALILCLGGAIAVLLRAQAMKRWDEVARLNARYRERLVPVSAAGTAAHENLIEVTSLEAFCRLADQDASPVIQQQRQFFFASGGATFRYVAHMPETADGPAIVEEQSDAQQTA